MKRSNLPVLDLKPYPARLPVAVPVWRAAAYVVAALTLGLIVGLFAGAETVFRSIDLDLAGLDEKYAATQAATDDALAACNEARAYLLKEGTE